MPKIDYAFADAESLTFIALPHRTWLQQSSQFLVGRQFSTRSAIAAIETELCRGAALLLTKVFLGFGPLVYFILPSEPTRAPLVAAFALSCLVRFFYKLA